MAIDCARAVDVSKTGAHVDVWNEIETQAVKIGQPHFKQYKYIIDDYKKVTMEQQLQLTNSKQHYYQCETVLGLLYDKVTKHLSHTQSASYCK